MGYPNNYGLMVVRYNDFTPERSTCNFPATLLTAANFDAQLADALALRDAIAAITLGLRVGFDVMNRYETVSPSLPASSKLAQREAKWLVRFIDAAANGPFRLEIPCPDLDFLNVNNRGYLDLTSTEGAAFKSAFEAYVVSKEGESVEILDVKHVGANI